jgi:hypothetical protein
VFEQTVAGNIGTVTIKNFDASKDLIILQQVLTTSVSIQDVNGNAVVTVDSSGDTITLVGVHSSAVQAVNDVHFV